MMGGEEGLLEVQSSKISRLVPGASRSSCTRTGEDQVLERGAEI